MSQLEILNPQPQLPLLSIVIPALEPDAELSRCINCIVGAMQGMSPPEIIIVTPHQFTASTSSLYPCAKVISETKHGIYSAMNDGAHVSCGDYIYFMGKDDMVLPTLSEALLLLKKNKPLALYCDVYWGVDGIYSGKPSPFKLLNKNLCHQGIIYSRQAFDTFGPYVRQMRVQADHFLNIKILWCKNSNRKILYLQKPLAWYSGDGFSTFNRDAIFWNYYPLILKKYVGRWAMLLLIAYRILRGVHKPKINIVD